VKNVRQITVPDRLWVPLGRLAEELGTDPQALIQQALHALLRFHGALPAEADDTVPEPPREAVARRVLDTARDLERAIAPGLAGDAAATARPGAATGPSTLWIHGENGPLARVVGERFLIGRGRHCDLVIDSAKVSREHAIVRREEDGWWIEDLGSSNGTWYRQARIDRRRIADGDEYFICAERLRCVLT
jgi:pSer/pThr/pTyr-binding forkhead associated (FHA) protein